jgi:hypothetical protein
MQALNQVTGRGKKKKKEKKKKKMHCLQDRRKGKKWGGKSDREVNKVQSKRIFQISSHQDFFFLDSSDQEPGAVCNVLDSALQRGVDTENTVGTGRLVANRKIKSTLIVNSNSASRVENVPKTIVLSDPALRLAKARGNKVHAVGG